MTTKEGALESGVKGVVVFDTNAYRILTYGRSVEESREVARRLADVELASGIKALANPFVIWELVSHLADPDDQAFVHCQNALVALVEHVRLAGDSAGGICRVADGETEPCRQLFGVVPPMAEENAGNLSKLATYVWRSAPDLSGANAQANFRAFSDRMETLEASWLDGMEALLDGLRSQAVAVPDSKGVPKTDLKSKREFLRGRRFETACATGKVLNLARAVDKQLSESELKDAAARLREIFPASLSLMQKTVAKWFEAPEINLRSPKRKRANFVWDTALCFGVGPKHQIGEAGIVFVTGDKPIHEAAQSAGCGDRVVTLSDHQSGLSFVP